ncbi:LiaI-LiaF-like domain-containing protein [Sphingobacterium spiritivorum]|uniref:LiaI-LiaF-like domain-containing protein n=1 Tax=Sphingobacterium spiritivorum TaxID=258 RepID=UPI001918F2FA|nr:DUF5668 domain-containing protein [Sphingobacterium spiritivorum]QQT26915.1 hypothetical protein I6J02_03340 [Sphingobacterium spiritivorum]
MNNKRITSGLIFLFVGIILLLDVLDIIEFNWLEIIRYWPLLIILGGINMLMPNGQSGQIAKLGFTCLLLGFLVFIGFTTPNESLISRFFKGSNIHISTDELEDSIPSSSSKSLAIQLPKNLSVAKANFDIGTTNLKLSSQPSSLLFEAGNSSDSYFLKLTSDSAEDGTATVDLTGKKRKKGRSKNNTTLFKLNKDVVWDLNFDIGASDVQMDLSPFKIRNINFDTGASSVNMKLGRPVETSTINIDAGASSVEIRIPKDVPCQVTSDSGLSSIELGSGFVRKGDGISETANYPQATSKYNIVIDAGVTSFKIIQY